MSRINRRNWTEDMIGIKSSGGLFDLFDNQIKSIYRITDEEYDLLCESMTEEETDIFVGDKDKSFTHGKKLINILNKYVNYE